MLGTLGCLKFSTTATSLTTTTTSKAPKIIVQLPSAAGGHRDISPQ